MLVKDKFNLGRGYPPNQEIGIEIEMEGRRLIDQRLATRYWDTKGDGSLRGEAVEWVLNQPLSYHQACRALGRLNREIMENRVVCNPSDRCGVHIHLNMRNTPWEQCMNVILLYLAVEDVLMAYCGASREGNMFCLRASDAPYLLSVLAYIRRTGDVSRLRMRPDEIRYASLNLGALTNYGSLEFRGLLTPKNVLEVREWIDILRALRVKAEGLDDAQQIVERYSMCTPSEFLEWVFGKELSSILNKRVKGVPDKLQRSIRAVQDVAYIPMAPEPEKPIGKKKDDQWVVYGMPDMWENNDTGLERYQMNPLRPRAEREEARRRAHERIDRLNEIIRRHEQEQNR